MPRYNVKYPSGRWRVFSSVVDDWITPLMTFNELKAWRREEYGYQSGATDEESDSLLTLKPLCNVMSYEDACRIRRLNR